MSSLDSPVRNPDVRNPEVMTRRGWILVVLNVLIPGSAQLLAGNRRLGRFGVVSTFVLWALLLVAALLYFFARVTFITLATNFFVLIALQVLVVFYLVVWLVLTLDALRLVRLVRFAQRARAVMCTAAPRCIALCSVARLGRYAVQRCDGVHVDMQPDS